MPYQRARITRGALQHRHRMRRCMAYSGVLHVVAPGFELVGEGDVMGTKRNRGAVSQQEDDLSRLASPLKLFGYDIKKPPTGVLSSCHLRNLRKRNGGYSFLC